MFCIWALRSHHRANVVSMLYKSHYLDDIQSMVKKLFEVSKLGYLCMIMVYNCNSLVIHQSYYSIQYVLLSIVQVFVLQHEHKQAPNFRMVGVLFHWIRQLQLELKIHEIRRCSLRHFDVHVIYLSMNVTVLSRKRNKRHWHLFKLVSVRIKQRHRSKIVRKFHFILR